jgi:O-acetyl-ADP-ribose deacetylase (regulator of RNase III)
MKKNPYSKIDIVRGDITKLDVDAIVNAANTTLLGEAKLTRGYRLPARFVIHTVGPVWRGGKGDEPETLANCYRNSLQLAVENEIKTIAFRGNQLRRIWLSDSRRGPGRFEDRPRFSHD